MRVGYAKFGRNIKFDRNRFGYQGDVEAPRLLEILAERSPHIEWVIVGKNDCATDYLPGNVTNLWRPDVPRAPFVHADGAHRCAFCKTEAPHGFEFDCCVKGKYAWDYQQYVVAMMAQLDGFVVHLGQHGNTHSPIPPANKTWDSGELTNTYAWARNYGRYLVEGLNAAGDRSNGQVPVVWICADPRNYIKARDIKWPTGGDEILAQYDFERMWKHDRFLDPRKPEDFSDMFARSKLDRQGELWKTRTAYVYAGAELLNVPSDWTSWGTRSFEERAPVGVATTTYWQSFDPSHRRSRFVIDYLLKNFPDAEVHGKWDERSKKELEEAGFEVVKHPTETFADRLASWRTTIALPPPALKKQDLSWTTAKPWQAFAARTVCFMPGRIDGQGWIIPSRRRPTDGEYIEQVADGLWSGREDWTPDEIALAGWLRVDSPEEFAVRVQHASESQEVWEWLVHTQRQLLERRLQEQMLERSIERRLGIHAG